MKNVVIAFVAASVTLFAVTSFAASRESAPVVVGQTAEECGKAGESCKGSVRCCEGLTCQSSSGGDPTCVER